MPRGKGLWVFEETIDFFSEYDLGMKLGGGAYGTFPALTASP
jgi:hypothetical protein